ncbi:MULTISPECIES: undecaprenyldiphospho-muramoylpentapeptide beta-N-acetylglucosaminyltransferase [unclassified Treponema]|uniref:undecaprenyldiphospho-muramoylpentapeptide beta-N-acetylglucosaminyltransferase n=1 Tax=unclassified Treponema TaxID=2638727 RepID=UPI000E90687B|nr:MULTISPECIES: undecaprenyldiphospho-muramoylpentapeptide beta-N-acetylglucosaminyltransferase [unclassified Treponema]HBP09938.1 undecaprenyldiphospho-muramoylpentapeptide beta-N-acetylglucosaminyltransferase [Treponema sp.]
MSKKKIVIAFAGGGTGGHIYPGIAIADELKKFSNESTEIEIHWIGNSKGMDSAIIEKNLLSLGGSISCFHGIPCGKLRRYFSLKNFTDFFKIFAGFIKSFFILKKIKPDFLFSKGGFVSVPLCAAAALLKIPYFTHECDFTPGLATRINSKKASKILISYEETKKYFNDFQKKKCIVTGNPVRPAFYNDSSEAGKKFLGIDNGCKKNILLILGGSLGANQINNLVIECLDELKKDFIVVHQTGKKFAQENHDIMAFGDDNYKPYEFIFNEMVSVIQSADIIISRAGANSLWECAVCSKPMILIPLCGAGTRGDQVDNAEYFANRGAAIALTGKDATKENLLDALSEMKNSETRNKFAESCKSICKEKKPSEIIANLILEQIKI